MLKIKRTEEFSAWRSKIKDGLTKRRLAHRLEKVQTGNLGDIKPVGAVFLRCASISGRVGGCIMFNVVMY